MAAAEPKPSLVERLFAEHRAALQTFFLRRIRSKADAADLKYVTHGLSHCRRRMAQVYGENLTDMRAQLYANYTQWYKAVTVSRPRTIGGSSAGPTVRRRSQRYDISHWDSRVSVRCLWNAI
jgi:hypothetical protein